MDHFFQIQVLLDKNLFWGISLDSWFTGFIPILIFILGYIVNELIKTRNEHKRLEKLEEYFRKIVELLNKPINKQINAFLKFSHSLKEKKEQLLILDNITDFHVEQIKEISSKDLYTIFIKNRKGNLNLKTSLYGKLRANIDFINEVKQTLKDYFPLFMNKYDKYQQDYKLNIENISVLFHSLVSENLNSSNESDPFLKELDKIISNWQSIQKSDLKYNDMYVTKEHFIEPIRNLCTSYFTNPGSVIISKYIMQCVYAFNNLEETKKVFRRHYLLLAKKLQNSLYEINGTLKKFDSLKKSN